MKFDKALKEGRFSKWSMNCVEAWVTKMQESIFAQRSCAKGTAHGCAEGPAVLGALNLGSGSGETRETRREYVHVGSTPTSCRRRSRKSLRNHCRANFGLEIN